MLLLVPSGNSNRPLILKDSFLINVPETCSRLITAPAPPSVKPVAPLDKPSIKLPSGRLARVVVAIVIFVYNWISNKYKSNLVVDPVYDASVFSNEYILAFPISLPAAAGSLPVPFL